MEHILRMFLAGMQLAAFVTGFVFAVAIAALIVLVGLSLLIG